MKCLDEMTRWKRSLFIRELHWAKRVRQNVLSREGRNISRTVFVTRCKIFFGVVSSFLYNTWRGKSQRFIFVAFGSDTLSQVAKAHFRDKVIISNNRLFDIAIGRSLIELDALYYLIHDREIIPKIVRKTLIRILLKWTYVNLVGNKSNLFIVKEDYYGKASVLTSISMDSNIVVAGIQHGLLRHQYLTSSDIYPGIRTFLEAVYDDKYATLMLDKKPIGTKVYVFGPPFDKQSPLPPFSTDLTVYFISSGDLRSPEKQAEIYRLAKDCKENGIDFYCRPHPSEIRFKFVETLKRDSRPKAELLSLCPGTVIFIGFFSTLLYEAALSGFRTIWISNKLSVTPNQEFPEVSSLVSAHFLNPNDLTAAHLLEMFNSPVRLQNLSLSLPARIERLFNEILAASVISTQSELRKTDQHV